MFRNTSSWFLGLVMLLSPFVALAVPVGRCDDPINQVSFAVDSSLAMQNIANPNHVFYAQRDPSGMTLMLLPSANPVFRYWITWDMRLIRIAPNGAWMQIGHCNLHPNFVQSMRPQIVYQPVLQTMPVPGDFGSPLPPQQIEVVSPAHNEDDDYELRFLATSVPRVKNAEECIVQANNDRGAFYDCMAQSLMGDKELYAYQCMRDSDGNREQTALCLLKQQVGANERAALDAVAQCARAYNNDWRQYPVCLSTQLNFDQKTYRAIECAKHNLSQTNPNYWGMAACYIGPDVVNNFNPNAETTIAIECAMTSGGEPTTFVGCTSGALVAKELARCLTHGVGGSGCLGEGNTITRAYEAVGNEIAEAYGKESLAYQAWTAYAATTNPLYTIEVAQNIGKEAEKAINNVARESTKAAKNIKREVKKVLPRVKVKRIKITW